ncbi:MAG TPA: DNA-3-methyladenine glycosylase I [Terriglobales bacterium]|nr:DNA-3-methyladenine glycosylase I [Terriglobales bacterium]
MSEAEKKRAPRRQRCWGEADPLMAAYHDEEWGAPLHDDRKIFEFLILEGMQAGLSWRTILNKRENFRRAFDGFDPVRVARYTARDVRRLLADAGIIRNRLKILAAINNARRFLEVQKEFGSFDRYIWGFVGRKTITNRLKSFSRLPARTALSDRISEDLKARGFKFVGSTIVYSHLQATGIVNDHLVTCFRYGELERAAGPGRGLTSPKP